MKNEKKAMSTASVGTILTPAVTAQITGTVEAASDDPGTRIAHTAMAKVRILSGAQKGRHGDDRHADHKDTMHLPLTKAREGEALGLYEILEVIEPGMPPGGNK